MKNFTKKMLAMACMMLVAGGAQAQDKMIISKVFYAGTTQKGNTKNYTGGEEYIELHNNSASEIDIAGYYIGLIESEATTGAYLAADEPKNFVKLKQVYQIPTDKEMKVPAWGNVVIAACAKDHSAEAENGPDLSKAELSFGNMAGDAEGVAVMNLVFSFNSSTKAVNLTNGGDAGVILITKTNGDKYLTASDESTWVYANGKDKGSQYLPFNAAYAMDCVEILKTKATDGVYSVDPARKRLKDSYDKGYVPATEKMLRDGFVAYRKTALNNDGQILLYDTQNSCTDFAISNTIGVKEYDAQESGLTEVKVTIPESGYLPFNAEKYFITGKELYLAYVSISSGAVKFNNTPGHTKIANNSPFILVGAPGEHVIYYTEAQRNLASAGANSWINDDDSKYANGVLTITTKNRFPMKFVNEKGNVRFERDCVEGNNQTLKIDVEKEGRLYINHTAFNADEPVIKWGGITPEEIIAGIDMPVMNVKSASTAVYNLNGQRVNASAKGIVIKAGKKYINK